MGIAGRDYYGDDPVKIGADLDPICNGLTNLAILDVPLNCDLNNSQLAFEMPTMTTSSRCEKNRRHPWLEQTC